MTPEDRALDDVVLSLPHGVDAPAMARAYVSEHAGALPTAVVEDARLLVSELVGNAVRYGAAEIVLRVRTRPPGIGISVADRGTTLPTLPDGRPDPMQPTGRGLLIVATLASTWGIEPSRPGPGKTVWFELRP